MKLMIYFYLGTYVLSSSSFNSTGFAGNLKSTFCLNIKKIIFKYKEQIT